MLKMRHRKTKRRWEYNDISTEKIENCTFSKCILFPENLRKRMCNVLWYCTHTHTRTLNNSKVQRRVKNWWLFGLRYNCCCCRTKSISNNGPCQEIKRWEKHMHMHNKSKWQTWENYIKSQWIKRKRGKKIDWKRRRNYFILKSISEYKECL